MTPTFGIAIPSRLRLAQRWVSRLFGLLLLLGSLAGCTAPSLYNFAALPVFATVMGVESEVSRPIPAEPPAHAADGAILPGENGRGIAEDEQPVTFIPLPPPWDDAELEYSGMAWYGDRLVLLPQYPGRHDNVLPTLLRDEIDAFLRGEIEGPLTIHPLLFDDGGMATMVTGFQGYESIAFYGDDAYVTVETSPGNWMLGYILSGSVDPNSDTLRLDPQRRSPVPVQAAIGNLTDETLIIDGDRVLTLYEANGVGVNAQPVVNVFSRQLEPLEPLVFANIEYRITDATEADEQGRFWAINYFFPGDTWLKPETDPLAERYGQGTTHRNSAPVERLVEMQIEGDAVHLADAPPIQLSLSPLGLARNWEGIVRFDAAPVDGDDPVSQRHGFLLVTDKFPSTLLAFVPMPDGR